MQLAVKAKRMSRTVLPWFEEASLPGSPLTNKRPLPVTIVGCLLVATGAAGLVIHLSEVTPQRPFQSDIVWIALVSLAAVAGGIATLRGHNWGRWLALAWISFHVILSFFHSWQQTAVHAILLALFAYALFYPEANGFFTRRPEV
jgi:hypothetical protein